MAIPYLSLNTVLVTVTLLYLPEHEPGLAVDVTPVNTAGICSTGAIGQGGVRALHIYTGFMQQRLIDKTR